MMTDNSPRHTDTTENHRVHKENEELLKTSPSPFIMKSQSEISMDKSDVVAYQPVRLILPGYEYEEKGSQKSTSAESLHDLSLDKLPPLPHAQRRPMKAIGHAFAGNLFRRGDIPFEWGRKSAFWLSLLALLVSLIYVLYALWLLPMVNTHRYKEVFALYGGKSAEGIVSGDAYPAGMRAAFRNLYDINPDVRGFVEYHASSNNDFLDISYPILYSGNNTTYLTRDFFGKRNGYGALFFDERCCLNTADANNKTLIVYGQNGHGGQMLSGLNALVGNVNNARAAATLTMSTLYETNTYQVFAVVLTDENETGVVHFTTRRTSFSSDEDFIAYVEAARARSLFDYPVEVNSADTLLVLTTNASYSVSKLENGRITVFARLVTEDVPLDTKAIVKNDDVIMPLSWYFSQGLPVHPYYESVDGMSVSTVTSTTVTTEAQIEPNGMTEKTPETSAGTTSATTFSTTIRPRPIKTTGRRTTTIRSVAKTTTVETTSSRTTTTTDTTTMTEEVTTTTEQQTQEEPPAEISPINSDGDAEE